MLGVAARRSAIGVRPYRVLGRVRGASDAAPHAMCQRMIVARHEGLAQTSQGAVTENVGGHAVGLACGGVGRRVADGVFSDHHLSQFRLLARSPARRQHSAIAVSALLCASAPRLAEPVPLPVSGELLALV